MSTGSKMKVHVLVSTKHCARTVTQRPCHGSSRPIQPCVHRAAFRRRRGPIVLPILNVHIWWYCPASNGDAGDIAGLLPLQAQVPQPVCCSYRSKQAVQRRAGLRDTQGYRVLRPPTTGRSASSGFTSSPASMILVGVMFSGAELGHFDTQSWGNGCPVCGEACGRSYAGAEADVCLCAHGKWCSAPLFTGRSRDPRHIELLASGRRDRYRFAPARTSVSWVAVAADMIVAQQHINHTFQAV